LTFIDVPEGSSTQFLPIVLDVLEEWRKRLGWGIYRGFVPYLERNDIESVGVHGGGR
jgi:hypothetical protein